MADIRAEYINLIDRLVEGDVPEATPEQIDGLLHWLARRGNESADAVATAFEFHNVLEDQARRCTMVYLDATLFAHNQDAYRVFGLAPDCRFDAIRHRHKQLIQVLHPDRHDDNQTWFMERSERINRAYADLKAHHGQPWTRTGPAAVKPAPPVRRPRPSTARTPTPWQSVFINRDKLRRQLKTYLGSSASLEKRIYIVLAAVPAILLTVLYINQAGIDDSRGRLAAVDTPLTPVADAVEDSRQPDDRAAAPVIAHTQAAQAGERMTRLAEAALRLQSAPTPASAIDADAFAAELIHDPGSGAVPPIRISSPVEAAVVAEADPVEPGNVEPPTVSATADARPHPETLVPTAIVMVRTGAAVTATTAEGIDEARSGDGDSLPAAEADQEDQLEAESPTDIATGQAPEQTGTETATAGQQVREAADAPAETPDKDPAKSTQNTLDPQSQRDQSPSADNTDKATADRAPAASHSDAAPQAATAMNTDHAAPEPSETPGSSAAADETRQAMAPEAQQPDPAERAIRAFLNQYRAAYNVSDIDRFSRLFQRDATSKHASNRSEIAKKYQSLFERTRDRNLVFRNVRFEQLGEREYKVRTHYVVQWTYPDGASKTSSGQFEMILVTNGRSLKIQRLNYE